MGTALASISVLLYRYGYCWHARISGTLAPSTGAEGTGTGVNYKVKASERSTHHPPVLKD